MRKWKTFLCLLPSSKQNEGILALTSLLMLAMVYAYIADISSDLLPSNVLVNYYEEQELQQEKEYCTSVQKQRLSRLREACSVLKRDERYAQILSQESPGISNVWLNKPRQLAICTPHKVGSQTWRYFFQQLDLTDQQKLGQQDTIIEEYFADTWPSTPEDYIKAFQVRHPLERLLSSYRFVFERPSMKSINFDLVKHIMDTYPEGTNQTSKDISPLSYTPSFRQFCQFVADADFDVEKYPSTSHWLPFYLQCNPCHGDYQPNFVIAMESMVKDTLCFLDAGRDISMENVQHLHHVNMSPKGHSSAHEIQSKYFSQLDENLLKRIQNKYWPDFLIYGYDLEAFLKLLE